MPRVSIKVQAHVSNYIFRFPVDFQSIKFQVNLIHVASTYKNAADEKLKQSIRRFADIHGSPACIILISSDINFAADLSDIRHRKKIHVILLHNDNSSEALILCANEHFHFSKLMESLPIRTPSKVKNKKKDTTVFAS